MNNHNINDLFNLLFQNHNAFGFDKVFYQPSSAQKYPPYNVKRKDDEYTLEFAVAGYSEKDISINREQNMLTVEGGMDDDENDVEYMHRGIAARRFKQSFTIPEYMIVDKAELRDGILRIFMKYVVPEQLKPQQIPIIRKDYKMLE